jgi:hypothetical protein
MDFCACEVANILQNMSQNRINKKISIADIKFAMIAAYNTVYPAASMFLTAQNKRIYGHFPIGFVVYVKGKADGNADVLWRMQYNFESNSSPQGNANTGLRPASMTASDAASSIKYLTNSPAHLICKDLKINEGEIKILVECSIVAGWSVFWILRPPMFASSCFTRVVIFTPKPGLFDENPPSG